MSGLLTQISQTLGGQSSDEAARLMCFRFYGVGAAALHFPKVAVAEACQTKLVFRRAHGDFATQGVASEPRQAF